MTVWSSICIDDLTKFVRFRLFWPFSRSANKTKPENSENATWQLYLTHTLHISLPLPPFQLHQRVIVPPLTSETGDKERDREMAATKSRDIDDLPKIQANYTALTPLWFLDRAAAVHPTRKSLIHGSLEYTWRQTYERCRRLASALADRSIGPGSTVIALDLPFF